MVGVFFTRIAETYLGGKRGVFICLTMAVAIVLIPHYFVSSNDHVLIFAIHLLSSFLSGPLMPLFWAMIADTADYAEWRFGRRFTGLIFSVGTFSNKAGWAIGSAFTAYTLPCFGCEANAVQSSRQVSGC